MCNQNSVHEIEYCQYPESPSGSMLSSYYFLKKNLDFKTIDKFSLFRDFNLFVVYTTLCQASLTPHSTCNIYVLLNDLLIPLAINYSIIHYNSYIILYIYHNSIYPF